MGTLLVFMLANEQMWVWGRLLLSVVITFLLSSSAVCCLVVVHDQKSVSKRRN